VVITDGPADALAEYARIPIAFEVRSVLEVEARGGGLGGFVLAERPVRTPWVKDYDQDADRPARWARRFDVSRWRAFAAHDEGRMVGGAVVAWNTQGVHMLEERSDLAVLWDIRVLPSARGKGVGAALLRAAEAWSRERGCRWMKIETQNINVPACRFYAHMGCELGAIHRFAYPDLPSEVQLLWYRELAPAGDSAQG